MCLYKKTITFIIELNSKKVKFTLMEQWYVCVYCAVLCCTVLFNVQSALRQPTTCHQRNSVNVLYYCTVHYTYSYRAGSARIADVCTTHLYSMYGAQSSYVSTGGIVLKQDCRTVLAMRAY